MLEVDNLSRVALVIGDSDDNSLNMVFLNYSSIHNDVVVFIFAYIFFSIIINASYSIHFLVNLSLYLENFKS